MSDLFKNLNRSGMGGKGSPMMTREAAVGAALELISARVSSPGIVELKNEMDNLSRYADQIQAALQTAE
ncbi:hypothetical protein [Pseudomonas sp. UBA6562]|uniref:hypothetical protein n=1 Tax=Pseudomonas sp. UBA6562 TaxID=1947332 RepID=UPI0025E0767B|nr:hypothetical protein [Pseudomonas sp. UBA6562]